MTIGQMMLGEFDQEMQNTRKTLERCPDEKWNWKPHEKSGTVGWLAGHIATMPGWVAMTINTEELDYAPVGGPSYQPPKIENKRALLTELDKNVAEARAALASVSDAEMNQAMSVQRFPAVLQGSWDQIRSTLNNLARVYKVEMLAVLDSTRPASAVTSMRSFTLPSSS